MKRSLPSCLLTLLCAMAAFGAHASDAAKATPKGDAARGQAVASTVCVACHGPDGNSPLAVNPKLAGQHPDYLLKQMKNFKAADGKQPERVNAIMNGMIAAYDEGQMRDLSAYFASQVQKGETAKNRETIELGQKLYRAGDMSKGLPACAACHGPAGAGIPAQYPRIGGQFPEYMEAQMKSFRDGGRANDPNKMMRMVALKMTDAEIKAVADYVAGLR
ncbi:MAG: cc42 [Rhodocyclaceae bacterium]|nr:MAG: cc42 [Rhodocyclaceae bacterium]TND04732.1 MAG: cc42 [Rhodocyclaceae bacterium]